MGRAGSSTGLGRAARQSDRRCHARRVTCLCDLLIAKIEISARRGRYEFCTVSTVCHIGRHGQDSDIVRTMTCGKEPVELRRRRLPLCCADRKHGHQTRTRSQSTAPCAQRRVCDKARVPFWETENRRTGVRWTARIMLWKGCNRRDWTDEVKEQVQDEYSSS